MKLEIGTPGCLYFGEDDKSECEIGEDEEEIETKAAGVSGIIAQDFQATRLLLTPL